MDELDFSKVREIYQSKDFQDFKERYSKEKKSPLLKQRREIERKLRKMRKEIIQADYICFIDYLKNTLKIK